MREIKLGMQVRVKHKPAAYWLAEAKRRHIEFCQRFYLYSPSGLPVAYECNSKWVRFIVDAVRFAYWHPVRCSLLGPRRRGSTTRRQQGLDRP